MGEKTTVEINDMRRLKQFALNKGGFGDNAKQKKAAAQLIKDMSSTKSVSGRQQEVMTMLRKGATLEQMMKATGSSRRTVFRYLNHFEEAGLDMVLEKGFYKLK